MTETAVVPSKPRLAASVAGEVRAEMARQQISGRALAQKMGRSPNWVSLKTSGASVIDMEDLESIADALGVGIVDLLPTSARKPTRQYPAEPVVTGTHAHPGHPIVAAAVRLPAPIQRPRPAGQNGPAGQGRIILKAPGDSALSM